MVPKNLNLKYEGNLCFWKFLTVFVQLACNYIPVFVQFPDMMCCDWKPLDFTARQRWA